MLEICAGLCLGSFGLLLFVVRASGLELHAPPMQRAPRDKNRAP